MQGRMLSAARMAMARRSLSNVRVQTQLSASEALVLAMKAQGVDQIFGIIGSAFIDPADLFPEAGIEFVDTQHELNAVLMADANARIKGTVGVAMGQNGPGITNMVTGVATAFMNQAPVVVVTPQAGTDSFGKLGFQELDQLPMLSNITVHQEHVAHAGRIAEQTARTFDLARRLHGPAQLNYPRNLLYEVHDYDIPNPMPAPKPGLSETAIEAVRDEVARATRPVIVAGGGLSTAHDVARIADQLDCPVATSYTHSDVFSYPERWVGSLGYMGSKAAMRCVQEADLILAVGSRVNPFGVTRQYDTTYWDARKPLIQIDDNPKALGRSCFPTLALQADAATAARQLADAGLERADGASIPHRQYLAEWVAELEETSRQPAGDGPLRPKAVLWTIREALGTLERPIVTTDIGHCCSQALSYLECHVRLLSAGTFGSCGTSIPMALGARMADPDAPVVALVGDGAVNMQGINELLTAHRRNLGVTVVVFRNNIWGAELLNQLIWTDARTVGTVIEKTPPIHKIAQAFGVDGVEVKTLEALETELAASIARQPEGRTTLIEVHCSTEMGAPFRSDAMRCPQRYHPDFEHLTTTTADYGRQYTPQ